MLAPASYFHHPFPHTTLEARLLHAPSKPIFALPGARSTYTTLNPLLHPLQQHGISSLSCNLSGHSTNTPETTSLANNLQESLTFAHTLMPNTIFGDSLGGALALKVAERLPCIQKIILSGPAIYTEAAYQHPFGPSFTQVISEPFSFLDSQSLPFLRTFPGKVILLLGQYDGLQGSTPGKSAGTVTINGKQWYSPIPAEVIAAIKDALGNRLHHITLPDCDHHNLPWLAHQAAESIILQLADFIIRPH